MEDSIIFDRDIVRLGNNSYRIVPIKTVHVIENRQNKKYEKVFLQLIKV